VIIILTVIISGVVMPQGFLDALSCLVLQRSRWMGGLL